MTVVEWCVSGAKDLRFIGRKFHKRGEELRNDRSANLSLVKTGGELNSCKGTVNRVRTRMNKRCGNGWRQC